MATKRDSKLTKQLFRELPYNGINIVYAHGQFNNILPSQIPTKRYLQRLTSIFDVDMFNLNEDNSMVDPELNCLFQNIRCKYYSPLSFKQPFKPNESAFSKLPFFYTNIRSLRSNADDFQCHILWELQSQSKWLGHFGVSLSPQCWCTRFGDRTAINNFERDEVSTRREKTAFG